MRLVNTGGRTWRSFCGGAEAAEPGTGMKTYGIRDTYKMCMRKGREPGLPVNVRTYRPPSAIRSRPQSSVVTSVGRDPYALRGGSSEPFVLLLLDSIIKKRTAYYVGVRIPQALFT